MKNVIFLLSIAIAQNSFSSVEITDALGRGIYSKATQQVIQMYCVARHEETSKCLMSQLGIQSGDTNDGDEFLGNENPTVELLGDKFAKQEDLKKFLLGVLKVSQADEVIAQLRDRKGENWQFKPKKFSNKSVQKIIQRLRLREGEIRAEIQKVEAAAALKVSRAETRNRINLESPEARESAIAAITDSELIAMAVAQELGACWILPMGAPSSSSYTTVAIVKIFFLGIKKVDIYGHRDREIEVAKEIRKTHKEANCIVELPQKELFRIQKYKGMSQFDIMNNTQTGSQVLHTGYSPHTPNTISNQVRQFEFGTCTIKRSEWFRFYSPHFGGGYSTPSVTYGFASPTSKMSEFKEYNEVAYQLAVNLIEGKCD